MIEPAALIAQARQWVGVRFLHQGRSRHGADCLGAISAILGELGSDVFLRYLPLNYARSPQSLLIDTLGQVSREIPLQPGAIITVQFPFTPYPSHAAIFTGESIIHAHARVQKVVEHGYQEPWIQNTRSIWAAPLVVYECSAR